MSGGSVEVVGRARHMRIRGAVARALGGNDREHDEDGDDGGGGRDD